MIFKNKVIFSRKLQGHHNKTLNLIGESNCINIPTPKKSALLELIKEPISVFSLRPRFITYAVSIVNTVIIPKRESHHQITSLS